MKIELNSNEIISLDDFKLGWRWDNIHNSGILPEDKIQLKPLSITESKSLYKVINFFQSENNLSNGFQPYGWILASSESKDSTERFSNYIQELTRNHDENIFISWNRSTCLYTSKDIFIKYWDDFCYPSSDDITIISELTNWVYFYNHIEVGQFWMRK